MQSRNLITLITIICLQNMAIGHKQVQEISLGQGEPISDKEEISMELIR